MLSVLSGLKALAFFQTVMMDIVQFTGEMAAMAVFLDTLERETQTLHQAPAATIAFIIAGGDGLHLRRNVE